MATNVRVPDASYFAHVWQAQRERDSVPQGQPPQQGNYEMTGMREPDRVAPPMGAAAGATGMSAFQQEVHPFRLPTSEQWLTVHFWNA